MKASKFTLGIVVLMLLAVSGWASDKMKTNIQIFETVQVASPRLTPGAYRMTWTDSGSNAEVTFSQGKKMIVTLPAQASREGRGYDFPALHIDGASNMLIGVELPKVLLSFTHENAVRANSGD
jgi:hypothetical protein